MWEDGAGASALPLEIDVPSQFTNASLSFYLSGKVSLMASIERGPTILLFDSTNTVVLEIELTFPQRLMRVTNRFQVGRPGEPDRQFHNYKELK